MLTYYAGRGGAVHHLVAAGVLFSYWYTKYTATIKIKAALPLNRKGLQFPILQLSILEASMLTLQHLYALFYSQLIKRCIGASVPFLRREVSPTAPSMIICNTRRMESSLGIMGNRFRIWMRRKDEHEDEDEYEYNRALYPPMTKTTTTTTTSCVTMHGVLFRVI